MSEDETRLVPAEDESVLTVVERTAPVPVTVHELATKVVAALDLIAAIIPDLRTPHPATAKKVRGARTVSREAVNSIVAMFEASPVLQRMGTMDLDRLREVLSSADGYRLLGERLDMLSTQVKYTAEARWSEAVSEAMYTYTMATNLATDPAHADLAPHVATIRGHLGRRNAATGKKRKKKAEEE